MTKRASLLHRVDVVRQFLTGAWRLRRCVLRSLIMAGAIACDHSARAQFTRFQNYTDEQGLGDMTVTAIVQDENGYMILGTQGGLFRYDGQAITPYDMSGGLAPSSWIRQLLRDDQNRLWVVTSTNIYVRMGTTFQQVDLGGRPFKAASPHLLTIVGQTVVVNVNGMLLQADLTADHVGAFRPVFDRTALSIKPQLGQAGFETAGHSRELWFGCADTLCRLGPNGDVSVVSHLSGLPPDLWRAGLVSADGTFWTRSLSKLAFKAEGSERFTTIEIPGTHETYLTGHPDEIELAADLRRGVLTQGDDGYLLWNGRNWVKHPHHQDGVPSGAILSFRFDREGSLWLGSTGGGAFRSLGAGVWEHWTTEDGLPNNIVWSVARLPNGSLWVATDGGSVPLDRSTTMLPGSNFSLAVSRAGRLWAGPFGSPLLRVDPATGHVEPTSITGSVKGARVDQANRLWISTGQSVLMLPDADASISQHWVSIGSMSDVLDVTAKQSGQIWIASSDGIFRWQSDGRTKMIIPPPVLKGTPFAADFLASNELWVATQTAGVLRFKIDGDKWVGLGAITTPDLASDDLLSLHHDAKGRMWIATDRGISMFDGHGWHRFDSGDGPISNDMSQSAILEDRDGSMWFGTSHGLSHLIDPNSLPSLGTLHAPIVTRVSLGPTAVVPSRRLRIAWVRGPLSIKFDDLDYIGDRTMHFRYKVAGIDTAWNETSDRTIQYAAPPSGDLVLRLVAVDPIGARQSPVTTLVIHIDAPWWQRQSAAWILAAVTCGLVLLAWWMRIRFLMQQQGRLEGLVRERTKEIAEAREAMTQRAILEQQRLEHMVEIRTREIEEARVELQRMALSDLLTGLPNRRAIMLALDDAIASARASSTSLAVLLCDVDLFKSVNDQHGHLAGDSVLSHFGERLQNAVSSPELAGRYGGEEFLVVLPGGVAEVEMRIQAIHAALRANPYAVNSSICTITASGGVAFLNDEDTSVTLVARADVALYLAKENGRDRIEFEKDTTKVRRRAPQMIRDFELERDLRQALKLGEFHLVFQPVVDVVGRRITSCEALLRWSSPTRGNVSPADFIPFAEKHGLMPEIGAWVLRTACREAALWPDGVGVSINISPSQFYEANLVANVAETLSDAGLSADRLELEVTETVMIGDVTAASSVLLKLRSLGLTIALDDFGTGFSSLSFVKTLPFDRIKIDRSFVVGIGVDARATAIIGGIIHLCNGMGAAVTAEGAETEGQIELLRAAGCREVQGFAISRPTAPAELRNWMTAYTSGKTLSSQRAKLTEPVSSMILC